MPPVLYLLRHDEPSAFGEMAFDAGAAFEGAEVFVTPQGVIDPVVFTEGAFGRGPLGLKGSDRTPTCTCTSRILSIRE